MIVQAVFNGPCRESHAFKDLIYALIASNEYFCVVFLSLNFYEESF